MKKLLVVVLSFLSLHLYAQSNIIDSSKLTAGKVYDDVKTALSGIAVGLKTSAEHVYPILVKQQQVKSITNLSIMGMTTLLFLGLLIGMVKNFKLYHKVGHSFNGDDLGNHASSILLIVFTIICFIILMVVVGNLFSETVTGFVNPEYGAIKDIFDFVHPASKCE